MSSTTPRINPTFEAAIIAWLASASGVTVAWAEQDDELRPALPYVTANITSYGASEGFPSRISNGDDTFTKQIKKTLNVSVSAYGEESGVLIDLITDSVYNDILIDALKTAGLYFRTMGDPIPLAQIIETKWEQRWQLDVVFAYAKDITSNIGYIDRVSGTIQGNDFDTNNY